MSIPTEEQFNADEAAELAFIVFNPDNSPSHIEIDVQPGYSIDRNFAMALAERLLHLAQSLPDSPRILRRASDVDAHLRALDD